MLLRPILEIHEVNQTVPENDTTTQRRTIVWLELTKLRQDPLYIAVTCWVYLVVMYIIPLIILLVLNWRYDRIFYMMYIDMNNFFPLDNKYNNNS